MSAVARSRASDARQYTSWDRARLSVVVPIRVIVAVAIVCIVVAVLSSAQRADVVAVDHEKQMFSRALSNYGERVLREAESVASSEGAIQHIRQSFDYDWVNQRVGAWLEAYFDHDYIFVFDGNDRMAEGVETADQQLFLRAAGVHSMQGFRFGRPVTVAEISARLQSPGSFLPVEVTALAS